MGIFLPSGNFAQADAGRSGLIRSCLFDHWEQQGSQQRSGKVVHLKCLIVSRFWVESTLGRDPHRGVRHNDVESLQRLFCSLCKRQNRAILEKVELPDFDSGARFTFGSIRLESKLLYSSGAFGFSLVSPRSRNCRLASKPTPEFAPVTMAVWPARLTL